MPAAFDDEEVAALDQAVREHVGRDQIPGAAWLVARGGAVHIGVAGSVDGAGTRPVAEDTIFRIASATKPIAALGALQLVDDGVIGLDDPVDDLLPELADRQVLVRPDADLDDTVPANRAITVRDLLTFRLGWGFDFAATTPHTALAAMADLGIELGPPAPARHLGADAWLRRLGTLPLSYQPGDRWLYHAGAEVLGVLVGRATGSTLGEHLRTRLFEPLGMSDTGFWVPADAIDRFGPCFWRAEGPIPGQDPDHVLTDGGIPIYDAADGQWSAPPPFEDAGAGLVSTVRDLAAFGELMLGRGEWRGTRLVSAELVTQMTSDQLTAANRAVSGPDPAGDQTWGFGVGVQVRETGRGLAPGSYGWDGGLGSSWAADPSRSLTGVLLTNLAWTSPEPPPVCEAFWSRATALRP